MAACPPRHAASPDPNDPDPDRDGKPNSEDDDDDGDGDPDVTDLTPRPNPEPIPTPTPVVPPGPNPNPQAIALTATATNPTTIQLSWSGAAGTLYRSLQEAFTPGPQTRIDRGDDENDAEKTSYTDTGLTPDTTYYYALVPNGNALLTEGRANAKTEKAPPTSLKVEADDDTLVAGGVRVGRFYSSVAVNPHQTEITVTLTRNDGNVAERDVKFEIVPAPDAGEEGKPGFAKREDEPLSFDTTVKTNESGVARVVLNSGTRVGSIAVRVSSDAISVTKNFTVEEAKGKWDATAIGQDQNGDPILRLKLTHGGLPVNGHPISWRVTQVKLPNGNLVEVSQWSNYARLSGISANGEAISTTGSHGTPGEATAYIHLNLFIEQVLYSAVDTVIKKAATPSPNSLVSPLLAAAAGSPPSENQEYKEGATIETGEITMEEIEKDGDIVPGETPIDFSIGADEDALTFLGDEDIENAQIPVAFNNQITMEFEFDPEAIRSLGASELRSELTLTTPSPQQFKLANPNVAAITQEEAWASMDYFVKHFGPALVEETIRDTYNTEGTQLKRIKITIDYGIDGFGQAASDTVNMVLAPQETLNGLVVTVEGLSSDAKRRAFAAQVKSKMAKKYDLLYKDAVNGNGHKTAQFAGSGGGYLIFSASSGAAAAKGAKMLSQTPLFLKGAKIGTYAVKATMRNGGRIATASKLMARHGLASIAAKGMRVLGNRAKWKLTRKSPTMFAVDAVKHRGKINFYQKGKGYIIGVNNGDEVLGTITQGGRTIHCRYASIVCQVDKAGRILRIKSIQLLRYLKPICFTAGTPILMANGSHQVIENIKVGDLVMSRDEFTGQTSVQKVTQTFERQADATLGLRLKNGETIETTKEHPFYVESQGFTPAGEMGIGTSIVTRAGPVATLASSQVRNQKATVYNFEVENTHTYFVGRTNLWVHNTCLKVGQYLGGVMSKCPFKPALQASVSEAKVAEYLALLKSNPAAVWSKADKIIIDPDGFILNGYHRIVASELAGVAVPESAIYRTSMKAAVKRNWSDVIVDP